jgi:hypothetical protein
MKRLEVFTIGMSSNPFYPLCFNLKVITSRVLSEFEDEEESPEQVKPKPKARRKAANKDDHYDSDFVVEDDDVPLGMCSVY